MLASSRLAVAIFAVLLGAGCRPAPPAQGKNLLLITLDTTRADYLSCLGGPPGVTPNLDALAARSALFTRAFSQTNVTNPSHVTIFSGLPALRHGVLSNQIPLSPGVDTVANALRRQGYRTSACVSVRHLAEEAGIPGFDHFPAVRHPLSARAVTRCALRWLDRRGSGSFFLWVHYFDPHTPYQPPAAQARRFYTGDPAAGQGQRLTELVGHHGEGREEDWLGESRDPNWPRAMYAAEIADADQHIGRLLRRLERLGLGGETVVVVVADHGESLGEHDVFYSHQGLYEQQLHIPLLIQVPGFSGVRSDVLVSTLDVAPTLAALFGADVRNEMAGASLVPILRGRRPPASLVDRPPMVHQHAHNFAVAVRDGEWKLIWPLIAGRQGIPDGPRLFDLSRDPEERHDLAASEPERVSRLVARIGPWIALGVRQPGDVVHLDPEAVAQLEALGYL